MSTGAETVHATAVAVQGRGILIFGEPGRGKSDLALRLIDRGGVLVSDDYVEVVPQGGQLRCRAIASIEGRMEVRGVGIVTMRFMKEAPVALAVDLDLPPERLPPRSVRTIAGIGVPAIAVEAFEASAPVKIELALSGHVLPLD
jgi:serine kinase of HPr protein (carbohydrate metabolism regulator)